MISFEMGKKSQVKGVLFFCLFLKNFLHCVFVTFESLLPLEAWLRKRRVWAPQTHTHRTQETLFLFGSTFPLKTPLHDTKTRLREQFGCDRAELALFKRDISNQSIDYTNSP